MFGIFFEVHSCGLCQIWNFFRTYVVYQVLDPIIGTVVSLLVGNPGKECDTKQNGVKAILDPIKT